MKRFLLLATCTLALISISQAQITKGTVLVGTDAHYRSADVPGKKKEHYQFTPSIGYTFKDNQVAGLTLGYGHLEKNEAGAIGSSNTYIAGLFYRRYFHLIKGLHVYGQASADYAYSHAKTSYPTDYHTTTRQSTVSLGIYPGLSYQVHKRIHLEVAWRYLPTLNYNRIDSKGYSATNNSEAHLREFNIKTNNQSLSPISAGFRIGLGN